MRRALASTGREQGSITSRRATGQTTARRPPTVGNAGRPTRAATTAPLEDSPRPTPRGSRAGRSSGAADVAGTTASGRARFRLRRSAAGKTGQMGSGLDPATATNRTGAGRRSPTAASDAA